MHCWKQNLEVLGCKVYHLRDTSIPAFSYIKDPFQISLFMMKISLDFFSA
jgi:hypothetical protein